MPKKTVVIFCNSKFLYDHAISLSVVTHFFSNRVVNTWNNLPEYVVKAGSVDTLKNYIDKHWHVFTYFMNIN